MLLVQWFELNLYKIKSHLTYRTNGTFTNSAICFKNTNYTNMEKFRDNETILIYKYSLNVTLCKIVPKKLFQWEKLQITFLL